MMFYKEGVLMEYIKPAVIMAEKVNLAKCGDGPCGRPCDKKA